MEKKCSKCKEVKLKTEFNKSHRTKDGVRCECRSCQKIKGAEYYNKVRNTETYRKKVLLTIKARSDKYREDKEYREEIKRRGKAVYAKYNYRERYRPDYEKAMKKINLCKERYPEKIAARKKSGYIKKVDGFHNHHWSYKEEHCTDIIRVGKNDHPFLHTEMVYDKGTFMYRIKSTNELLDTKEKAVTFYKELGVAISEIPVNRKIGRPCKQR